MSYVDLFSSAIGTAVAELITLPICTVKTNYQSNLDHKSIGDVYRNIVKTRGIKGLYDASLSAMGSQIVSTATKFTFYNYIKNKRGTQENDIMNNVVNGGVAGIMASVLAHPIDVIKITQQNGLSYIDEFKKTGYKLIYRGYSKSITKHISLTALVFPLYDFYKSKTNNILIACGLSSLTTTVVLHPIDFLKVRHISDKQLYYSFNNIPDYFKYYYRGVHINLMRVMPHFMITMFLTEKIKKHLNE